MNTKTPSLRDFTFLLVIICYHNCVATRLTLIRTSNFHSDFWLLSSNSAKGKTPKSPKGEFFALISATANFVSSVFHRLTFCFRKTNSLLPNIVHLLKPLQGFGVVHSYLNASTGFRVAARQLCQLTVTKATPSASKPASAKIHQLNSVL